MSIGIIGNFNLLKTRTGNIYDEKTFLLDDIWSEAPKSIIQTSPLVVRSLRATNLVLLSAKFEDPAVPERSFQSCSICAFEKTTSDIFSSTSELAEA